MNTVSISPVPVDALPEYPIGPSDRLDSHYFVPWERRRWLNSTMRLKGDPVCRAIYLDLIWISYEQSPTGTLPDDTELLAKLSLVDHDQFRRLTAQDYGPLHNWTRCLIPETGEIRLQHPMVTATVTEAITRKEDNRARNEAANRSKRMQRLRAMVGGYDLALSKNDLAIRFMDEWLEKNATGYRTSEQVERAMQAFGNHMLDKTMRSQR